MGTRSVVTFMEDNQHICSIYQQYDGYLSGVGMELASFLDGIKIVNGIGHSPERVANGIECLAAQFIREYKTDAGGLYVISHPQEEEFNYVVNYDSDSQSLTVKVNDSSPVSLQDFIGMVKNADDYG